MRLAGRAAADGGINDIARARARLAAAGVDVLDLSDSNPTRHGLTHPGVLEAVRRHVPDAARYVPDPRGSHRARQALADRFGGEADDYWLTGSTSQAYSWLLTLLADPGDAVAVPVPGYPLVGPLARYAAVTTIDYRLDYVHPDGWITDPDSLRTAATDPRVRAVVAVDPGNPTGAYVGVDRALVVDCCERGGAALISDEVFAPFVLDGPASAGTRDDESIGILGPADGLVEARVPTFTLGGLSKLLCAPQLKLSWIRVSGPRSQLGALREALDSIADAFLPVSSPVDSALPDLLALANDSVAATRRRLTANLATARRVLADGAYRVRRCEGGWTVLVDVPRHLPIPDLALHLLTRDHLSVHPGWFYDVAGGNTLALSLLPEPESFERHLGVLRRAIDDLGSG